jgi:hypothetical protein
MQPFGYRGSEDDARALISEHLLDREAEEILESVWEEMAQRTGGAPIDQTEALARTAAILYERLGERLSGLSRIELYPDFPDMEEEG